MEKINVKAFALASASTFGVVSIVCALLFWIAPAFALNLFNNVVHGIDLTSITKTSFSLSSAIIGLILAIILGYLLGALLAVFYNKFAAKGK